ncbi:MAG TPA: translation initiation factor IF-2 [Spirochaetota bacterium]|nr:translation initiation factor IF-2 [Spirochaetota bacterium]HOM38729.1 translation initiation factor IF-2 [Spirochaetota bacterium]HPQ49526.1 translation initiation factor IF-2 [Spirochaetota bacterium]
MEDKKDKIVIKKKIKLKVKKEKEEVDNIEQQNITTSVIQKDESKIEETVQKSQGKIKEFNKYKKTDFKKNDRFNSEQSKKGERANYKDRDIKDIRDIRDIRDIKDEKNERDNKKENKKNWKKFEFEEKDEEKEFVLKKKKEKKASIPEEIEIFDTILVKDLASKMNIKVGDLISKLIEMGYIATINDALDKETAEIIASEFGCRVKVRSIYDELHKLEMDEDIVDDKYKIKRAPIVTIMGHVDHGKTTLLDYIRKTRVVDKEAGGITQHIGAYQVEHDGKKITFIDTPGHEAFTKMRERGAQATDIVVLVVAADDGVMPQTIEALNHAKVAGVPIIVAVNKIDKDGANPDRVKQQLSEYNLIPEEWGGETLYVNVSALKGIGIDKLLEAILLQSEMIELSANPKKKGKGIIIETKVDKNRGSLVTLIVKDGTIKKGDYFVAGITYGKIRAMFDFNANMVKEAGPSMPVEILGFDELPEAGDILQVVDSEKKAKDIVSKRKEIKSLENAKKITKKVSLDDLYEKIQEQQKIDFNIIVKADVQGTAEAIKSLIEKFAARVNEVSIKVIHASVGAITENDIMLASASNAIIIAFNVRANNEKVNTLAKEKGVEIRKYSVIYHITEDIKDAIEGMLEPEEREEVIGKVEVRKVFKLTKIGIVAGCYVVDGVIKRTANVRLIRDGIVLQEVKISSLKRFKDDVKEVTKGFECGVTLDNCNDIKEGDYFEVYEIVKERRKLNVNTDNSPNK